MNAGIQRILPRALFQILEAKYPSRNNSMRVKIPSSETGGLSLLESGVLVTLSRLFELSKFFEFGSSEGATSVLLAENSAPHAQVVTLSTPAREYASVRPIQARIQQVQLDPTEVDVRGMGWHRAFDLVLIDGARDYQTIESATQNALQMIAPDAIVVWHDYESKIHGDMTHYINRYSQNNPIYHVQQTMLAFQVFGQFEMQLSAHLSARSKSR